MVFRSSSLSTLNLLKYFPSSVAAINLSLLALESNLHVFVNLFNRNCEFAHRNIVASRCRRLVTQNMYSNLSAPSVTHVQRRSNETNRWREVLALTCHRYRTSTAPQTCQTDEAVQRRGHPLHARVRRAQQSGPGNISPTRVMSGAPGAIRTRDTRFRRAVLYPLSYGGGYVTGRAGTRASASELLFYATCSTSSRRARAPPHRGGWQAARGASWDSDSRPCPGSRCAADESSSTRTRAR